MRCTLEGRYTPLCRRQPSRRWTVGGRVMTPRQATPPRAQPSRQAKPLTAPAVRARTGSGPPRVMVTAYDAPGARVADEAGVDSSLVGGSGAFVEPGYGD